MFELAQEVKIDLIISTDSVLTNDLFNVLNFLGIGVAVIELVGNVLVIFTTHTFTDSGLHQTGKGWEWIETWVDTRVAELSGNENLTFSNVTSKIWDGVGDIVVW